MQKKAFTVLISGSASGIGLKTAEYFLKTGSAVYGIDIQPTPLEGVVCFIADITSENSLNEISARLLSEGVKLDAIISVAGIHDMVSLVEAEYGRMKRLVEINLLGCMLAVRKLHSLLSERGRVIIVTSEVATYAPMPFNGLYNISKTALDCYADALRQELNILGQKVIAIRPGATETPLARGSHTSTAALAESTVLYKAEADRFSGLVKSFSGTPTSPDKIAALIYKATSAKHPRLSYSKNRNPGLVLLSLLPKRLQLFIIKLIVSAKK